MIDQRDELNRSLAGSDAEASGRGLRLAGLTLLLAYSGVWFVVGATEEPWLILLSVLPAALAFLGYRAPTVVGVLLLGGGLLLLLGALVLSADAGPYAAPVLLFGVIVGGAPAVSGLLFLAASRSARQTRENAARGSSAKRRP